MDIVLRTNPVVGTRDHSLFLSCSVNLLRSGLGELGSGVGKLASWEVELASGVGEWGS